MKLKTTFEVPKEDWRKFSIKVTEKRGNKQLGTVMVELVKRVNSGEIKI